MLNFFCHSSVSNSSLRQMSDSILQLLTSSNSGGGSCDQAPSSSMEGVLWPYLLEFLLNPEYTEAVPSVMKSLSCLAHRKRQSLVNYIVDYSELRFVPGPYVLFARLVVLVAVPFRQENRGANILVFLQHFAPNISKHLS